MAKSVTQEILTTSLTTAHTIGSGLRLAYLNFRFCNYSAGSRLLTVHLVPPAGSPANANKIIGHQSPIMIPSGATRTWQFLDQFLAGGYTIQWKCDLGTAVNASCSIDQVASSTAHIDIEPIALPNSNTAVQYGGGDYSVATNRVLAAGSLILHNFDTVARQVFFHQVLDGDGAGDKNLQWMPTLQPGETQSYPVDEYLPALGKIFWRASAAAAVSAKLSLFEEAVG